MNADVTVVRKALEFTEAKKAALRLARSLIGLTNHAERLEYAKELHELDTKANKYRAELRRLGFGEEA